jgi:hypothetical protein
MDERTLTALRGSIKHWEENLAAKKPEEAILGPRHCPLCVMFISMPACIGCPVREKTGKTNCGGTPYDQAAEAHESWSEYGDMRHDNQWREAAKAELDFLKSLLPKGSEQ